MNDKYGYDFDKNFNNEKFKTTFSKVEKVATTGVKLFAVIWVLFAILGLSLLGTLIYVAGHFIAKVW